MRSSQQSVLLNAATANGVGSKILAGDYKYMIIALATSSSASATIKVQGSYGKDNTVAGSAGNDAPDFSASATRTNQWGYISFVNLLSGSVVAGGTGVVYSGTDGVTYLKVNVEGLRFLSLEVSSYSAGTIDAKVIGFEDSDRM